MWNYNTYFTRWIGLFLIIALVVDAGEYCTDYSTGERDYCAGYCCSNDSISDNCCSDWGWIAGVVVGAIIFIAIVCTIIFLICHKMNAKKAQTVHVQMSNNPSYSYHNNNRNTRRQSNNNNYNTMFTTNMSGNSYLPKPPPYSQTYDTNPAYPPPPPYPGSPLPGSNVYTGGINATQPPQTQMTSHAQSTAFNAYPQPPVS